MDYQKDKKEQGENKELLLNKTNQKNAKKKEVKKKDSSNTLPDPCVPPSPLHRDPQKDPFSTDEITPSKSHKHPIVSMVEKEENSPHNKDEN
jgi:hypothetical protein